MITRYGQKSWLWRKSEHNSAQGELTKLRVQLEKVELEKSKHASMLDELESKHEKQTTIWESKTKSCKVRLKDYNSKLHLMN